MSIDNIDQEDIIGEVSNAMKTRLGARIHEPSDQSPHGHGGHDGRYPTRRD